MDDVWLSDDAFDHTLQYGPTPEFYAQVILTITDHASLLATPRLARLALSALRDGAAEAPGSLWGYVVLPDAIRLIIGRTGENALEAYISYVKAHTAHRLLNAILRADDDSLDAVLRYNPVHGGVIYQVWQPGSHRSIFWTEYKLSNALYALRQTPVELGLVKMADDWPYTYIVGVGSGESPPTVMP
jgi:hypothetical protein